MVVKCVRFPLPGLAVVPLQLGPGPGPGRPHGSLQAEEQQRSHVAAGGHAGRVGQKGNLLLLRSHQGVGGIGLF